MRHLAVRRALAIGTKVHRNGFYGFVLVLNHEDDQPLLMTVPTLTPRAIDRLGRLARGLSSFSASITFAARLRTPDGATCDVVVATDLSSGRQAVVRLSDGRRVRCGKVPHQGLDTLMKALANARAKDNRAVDDSTSTAPLEGRGARAR